MAPPRSFPFLQAASQTWQYASFNDADRNKALGGLWNNDLEGA